MSNVIQLYLNPSKSIKAYPKALASEVYMADGSKLTDYLSLNSGDMSNYYKKSEVDDLILKSKLESDGKYVQKEEGKGLSSNDFTTEEKNKLAMLQMPDVTKSYVDAQLSKKADIEHTHTMADISDFPTLSEVAITGSYNDLKDKPEIPDIDVNKDYVDSMLESKADVEHEHDISEISGIHGDIATQQYVDEAIEDFAEDFKNDNIDIFATKEDLELKADKVHRHPAENVEFANDQVIVEPFGGLKSGENLQGLSVEQVLSKLLFKHVNHSVSGSTSPNGGVFEKGDVQRVNAITAVVSKKSNPISKVEFLDGTTVLSEKIEGVANGGIFTLDDLDISVSTDKAFTVRATANGENGKPLPISSNTGKFTFVYPYYSGLCNSDAEINEGLIKGLDKTIEVKGSKTVTVDSKFQRMVFAYPKSYGKLRQVIDPNNFDVTNTFNIKEVTITGLDNTPQSYYVYVNSAFTASNFKFKFNY